MKGSDIVNNKVWVIAEAGVNHNGSLELAKKLAEQAKLAGADYVKFQTFKTENLVTLDAKKADYQIENAKEEESQFNMLKKLELSYKEFEELKLYCDEVGIKFLSTPFDLESIDFLRNLGMDLWKIPSGEITNRLYLEKISTMGMPIVLSTGMSDIDEIDVAINILREGGCKDITILHCTTEYPAPVDECNLNVIDTLKNRFKTTIGYSDHTEGIFIPVIAAAKGAKIIEKHFTLDRSMVGPDHRASLEPDELKEMIEQIRKVEKVLGDAEKKPTESEKKNRDIVRKSIVAGRDIKKGEIFSDENLEIKRPGTGISPMRWHDVIGRTAKKDYRKDEIIEI